MCPSGTLPVTSPPFLSTAHRGELCQHFTLLLCCFASIPILVTLCMGILTAPFSHSEEMSTALFFWAVLLRDYFNYVWRIPRAFQGKAAMSTLANLFAIPLRTPHLITPHANLPLSRSCPPRGADLQSSSQCFSPQELAFSMLLSCSTS